MQGKNGIILSLNVSGTVGQFNHDLKEILPKLNKDNLKVELGVSKKTQNNIITAIKNAIKSPDLPKIDLEVNTPDVLSEIAKIQTAIDGLGRKSINGEDTLGSVSVVDLQRASDSVNEIARKLESLNNKKLQIVDLRNADAQIKSIDNGMEQLQKTFEEMTGHRYDIGSSLGQYSDEVDKAILKGKQLTDALAKQYESIDLSKFEGKLTPSSKNFDSYQSSLTSLKSAISEIGTAINEYHNTGIISDSTLQNIKTAIISSKELSTTLRHEVIDTVKEIESLRLKKIDLIGTEDTVAGIEAIDERISVLLEDIKRLTGQEYNIKDFLGLGEYSKAIDTIVLNQKDKIDSIVSSAKALDSTSLSNLNSSIQQSTENVEKLGVSYDELTRKAEKAAVVLAKYKAGEALDESDVGVLNDYISSFERLNNEVSKVSTNASKAIGELEKAAKEQSRVTSETNKQIDADAVKLARRLQELESQKVKVFDSKESAGEFHKIQNEIDELRAKLKELGLEGVSASKILENAGESISVNKSAQKMAKDLDALILKAQKVDLSKIKDQFAEGTVYAERLGEEFAEVVAKEEDLSRAINEYRSTGNLMSDDNIALLQKKVDFEQKYIDLQKQEANDNREAMRLKNTAAAWEKLEARARDYYDEYAKIISQDPTSMAELDDLMAKITNHDFASPKDGLMALISAGNKFNELGVTTESTWQKALNMFKQHWGGAFIGSLVNAGRNSLRDIYQAVVDVDAAMVELKKVTDETAAGYDKILARAQTSAANIGSTVSNYINSVADFSRVGFNVEDAETLAEVANVYLNVADGMSDIGESTESLISTMKAFNMTADDGYHIIDAYNEVGNNFAISSAGLGEALQRSSSAMAAANNTFEETVGLTVAMNDSVQNTKQVGTTLKTVSMYLRAAESDLIDAGESTEGMAESVSKLRDVILELTASTSKPVDIMLDNNTYKSTYQILKEISQVRDEISDKNQAFLLEKLGGKRNANAVASLLNNFADAEAAMQTAVNSAGSALKENEKQLDSIAGKTVKLQSQFQVFSTTALDTGSVKVVLDGANGLLKALTFIVDKAGTFGTILSTVVTLSTKDIFAKWISGSEKLGNGLKNLWGDIKEGVKNFIMPGASLAQRDLDIRSLEKYTSQLREGKDAQLAFSNTMGGASKYAQDFALTIEDKVNTAVQNGVDRTQAMSDVIGEYPRHFEETAGAAAKASLKMKALSLATGLVEGAVLALISAVLQKLGSMFMDWVNGVDNAKQSIENFSNTVSDHQNKIRDIDSTYKKVKDRYIELSKGVNDAGENVSLTSNQFEEYKSISSEIANTFPTLISGYDETGNAILRCKDDVSQLTTAYKGLLAQEGADLLKESTTALKDFDEAVNGNVWSYTSFLGSNGYAQTNDALTYLRDRYSNRGQVTSADIIQGNTNRIFGALADAGLYSSKGKAYLDWEFNTSGFIKKINDNMPIIVSAIQSSESEIAEAANNLKTAIKLNLDLTDTFAFLDDESQQLADLILQAFSPEDLRSGNFKGIKDIGSWVEEFMKIYEDKLQDADNINLYNKLLGLDRDNMTVNDWQNTVNDLVDQFVSAISTTENPISKENVMELLGFDTSLNQVDNITRELEQKFADTSEKISSYLGNMDSKDLSNLSSFLDSSLAYGIHNLDELKTRLGAMDSLGEKLSYVADKFGTASKAALDYNEAVQAMNGSDYNMSQNTFKGAVDVIKEGLDSGNYRSQAVQLAVELIYGKDTLSKFLSGEMSKKDLEDQINLTESFYKITGNDADTALDNWDKLKAKVEEANKSGKELQSTLDESKDGTRTFNLVADDVATLAETFGFTEEQAWGFFQMLQSGAKVNIFGDGSGIVNDLTNLGLLVDGSTISASKLDEALELIGRNYGFDVTGEFEELKRVLEENGKTVVDFNADAETLRDTFAKLAGVTNSDLDITTVIDQMLSLGATREEIQGVVSSLMELDGTKSEAGVSITGLDKVDVDLEIGKRKVKDLIGMLEELSGIDGSVDFDSKDAEVYKAQIREAYDIITSLPDDVKTSLGIETDENGNLLLEAANGQTLTVPFEFVQKGESTETDGNTVKPSVDASQAVSDIDAFFDYYRQQVDEANSYELTPGKESHYTDDANFEKTKQNAYETYESVAGYFAKINELKASPEVDQEGLNTYQKSLDDALLALSEFPPEILSTFDIQMTDDGKMILLASGDHPIEIPLKAVKANGDYLDELKNNPPEVNANITADASQFNAEVDSANQRADAFSGTANKTLTADASQANSEIDGAKANGQSYGKPVTKRLLADGSQSLNTHAVLEAKGNNYKKPLTKDLKANNLASPVIDKISSAIRSVPEPKKITFTGGLSAGLSSAIQKIKDAASKALNLGGGAHRLNGTAHFSGTALASGNWGTKYGERALVGELGREIIVDPDTGRWRTIGDFGASFEYIPKGSIIFNHLQTEALLKNGYVSGRGAAFANGTAHASGTAYATGSKSSSSSSSSSGAAKTAAEKAADSWKEAHDYHKYLLDMDKTTEEEYWKWYEANYKKYLGNYKENLSEVRSAEVEVHNWRKAEASRAVTAWNEAVAEKEHLLNMEKISEVDYWTWYAANYKKYLGEYEDNIDDVWKAEEAIFKKRKEAIADAASAYKDFFEEANSRNKYLLDIGRISEEGYWDWYEENMYTYLNEHPENNEAMRDAEVSVYNYRKKAAEEAYNAVNDLVKVRIDMIKDELNASIDAINKERDDKIQAAEDEYDKLTKLAEDTRDQNVKTYEDESDKQVKILEKTRDKKIKDIEDTLKATKKAINAEIDAYKKLAQAQIDGLKSVADEEDYLKSQSEQRKNISDLEYQIQQLRAAGDQASIRKAIELEEELEKAKQDLTSFERDRAIEVREDEINKALDTIQEALNDKLDMEDETAQDEMDRIKEQYDDEIEATKEKYEKKIALAKSGADDEIAEYKRVKEEAIATAKSTAEGETAVLEDNLNNQKWLRDKAIEDISNSDEQFYRNMIAWNEKYGDGIKQTIIDKWDLASEAVQNYASELRELANIQIPDYVEDTYRLKDRNEIYTGTPPANVIPTYDTPSSGSGSNKNSASTDKPAASSSSSSGTIAKGATVTVKKTATNFSGKSGGIKMASFVPGSSYTVYQTSGNEVLIGKNGEYTGWVKKSDLVGYASGTDNAVGGLALTDEKGAELKLSQSTGAGKFSFLKSGDFVFTHEMSQRLYDFAKSDALNMALSSIASSSIRSNTPKINSSVNIEMGDIYIQGNANEKTISEIRREQRKATDDLLRKFKQLQ